MVQRSRSCVVVFGSEDSALAFVVAAGAYDVVAAPASGFSGEHAAELEGVG